jgi:hypothetical protein
MERSGIIDTTNTDRRGKLRGGEQLRENGVFISGWVSCALWWQGWVCGAGYHMGTWMGIPFPYPMLWWELVEDSFESLSSTDPSHAASQSNAKG